MISDFLRLMRIHHYLKNTFIFIPIFISGNLLNVRGLSATIMAFVAFSVAASCVYIFNDIKDVNSDRKHPKKKSRPLASGRISLKTAKCFLSLLIGCCALLLLCLERTAAGGILCYLIINILYTISLKKIAIVDVTCIAAGFVLRTVVGAVQADVLISHWLFLMIFLLSMFLALGKRRDDLVLSKQGVEIQRKSLSGYNLVFINQALSLIVAVTLVAYMMFTVQPQNVLRYGNTLHLTSIWVLLGILRYLQITYVQKGSGSPVMVLTKDLFLQLILGGWTLNYFLLIYF